MAAIKLFDRGILTNGTRVFQSQLYVGKDTNDFAMTSEGIMTYWTYQFGSPTWCEYLEAYEIVSNKSEMTTQQL